jgi:hypothetical protein
MSIIPYVEKKAQDALCAQVIHAHGALRKNQGKHDRHSPNFHPDSHRLFIQNTKGMIM